MPDRVFPERSGVQNINLLVGSPDEVVQLGAPVEMQGDRVLAGRHMHKGRSHWEQAPVGCEVIYAQSGTHDQQLQGLHCGLGVLAHAAPQGNHAGQKTCKHRSATCVHDDV